jgi:signal transduction histidine kinase
MKKSRVFTSANHFAGIGFNQLRSWISAKSATGLPLTFFVLIYPMAIGSLQQAFSGYEIPLPSWIWDLLLGVGVAAVLLFARLFVTRQTLLTHLTIWVIAAICGASLPILVSMPLGGAAESVVFGIPISALSLFGLQLFFTLAAGAINDYRASNKELLQIAAELEIRREGLNTELARRQKNLAEQILSEVEPRISTIQDLLRNADSKQASNEILYLIDNLVRPLSQGLSISTSVETERVPSVRVKPSLSALRRRFVRKLSVSSIFTPHLHVIFALSFFAPSMSLAAGLNGVVYLFGFLVLQVVVYALISRLLGEMRLQHWVLLISNLAAAAAANILFVAGSKAAGLADPEGLIAFVGLGVFLVFFAAGYVSIYSAAKQAANQEIRQATERLAYLVGELQLRTASLKKKFALDLHGDLQAKLQAALVRLERSASNDPAVVNQVLTDLGSATGSLQNPNAKAVGFEDIFVLPELWGGICEVTIEISESAKSKLSNNSGQTAVVLEIVRERIINAVKHSSAEEIDISVGLGGDDLVISTRNEDLGVGINLGFRQGGGSKLLDEVCRSWKLDFDDGDVVFEARLTA